MGLPPLFENLASRILCVCGAEQSGASQPATEWAA
jgi:hypothetical protein